MQLAKIQLARSIWLFDTAELNPYGTSLYSRLIPGLVQRYSFRKHPKWGNNFEVGNSLRFEFGDFVQEDGSTYEVAFEMFSDGITADSRHSTQICDLFIIDFLRWASAEFGLHFNPQVWLKKRIYRSEVIIYAQRGLGGICDRLDEMSRAVSEVAGPSEVTAVTFGNEGANSTLSFERRLNEPFANLKFYSAAALETQTHIQLLTKLGITLLGDAEREVLPESTDTEAHD